MVFGMRVAEKVAERSQKGGVSCFACLLAFPLFSRSDVGNDVLYDKKARRSECERAAGR